MEIIKGCNEKAIVFCIGDTKILYSYNTEIATYIYGKLIFKYPNADHTQTTKRHIKWFKELCGMTE